VRILVVNWNDRENPHGGGAEVHLHEIFGRIAALGHRVDLLASGWPGGAPRAFIDGIDIHRVGTRYSFQFNARRYFQERLAGNRYDVLVEDLNKIPLYTPRWNGPPVVALVHHLFGSTIFREAPVHMAASVWLAERGIYLVYRGRPFEAVSESTADDLAARGIPPRSGILLDTLLTRPLLRTRDDRRPACFVDDRYAEIRRLLQLGARSWPGDHQIGPGGDRSRDLGAQRLGLRLGFVA